MNEALSYISVSSDDLDPILDKLQDALDGVEYEKGVVAVIMLALILQRPNISGDQLQDCMDQLSQYVTMLLQSLDTPKVFNPKIN